MKFTKTQKIGFFVIVILIALFFAINFLKGYDLFNKNNTYYTYLAEVEGLTATSPVYIKGLKVGSIEHIKLDPVKDSFLVKMSIRNDYILPIDSRAEVYSSDVLGGKSLRIALGTAQLHARGGDTLKGRSVPDIISVLYGAVGPLRDKVSSVLTNLDSTLLIINSTLDKETQKNIQGAVAQLHTTLANTQQLTASLNEMTPSLAASLENINTITADLASPEGSLHSALDNINKTTAALSAAELSETVAQLNQLLAKIQDPNTTTGKLLTTDQLHNSLDSLLSQIDDLVKKIKENPKKYIKVSVF